MSKPFSSSSTLEAELPSGLRYSTKPDLSVVEPTPPEPHGQRSSPSRLGRTILRNTAASMPDWKAPEFPPPLPHVQRSSGSSPGRLGRSLLRNTTASIPSADSGDSGPATLGDSASRKRMSFFRKVIGQRNNDYRAGAPQAAIPASQRTMNSISEVPSRSLGHEDGRGSLDSTLTSDSQRPAMSRGCRQRCCSFLTSIRRPSPQTLDRCSRLINSRVWGGGLVFFTFVLLFGPQIQELWIPKGGDVAFDVLFMVTFVALSVDIIMRIAVEPSYFIFHFCGKGQERSSAWGTCRIGSFMFWCDLVPTALLLYDVSFINKNLFDVQTIDVTLDRFSLPADGVDQINSAIPFQWQPELIVTICRTARAARFIRASTVVKTSSKVHWYWLWRRLNPAFYYETISSRKAEDNNASERTSETSDRGVAQSERRSSPSWGDLTLKTTAMLQATKQPPEKVATGTTGGFKKMLKWMGFFSKEQDELQKRIIAACKIQRAWRSRTEIAHTADPLQSIRSDPAWESSRDPNNPVDEVMAKRSHARTTNIGRNIRKGAIPSIHFTIARSSAATPKRARQESQVGSAMRELTAQRVAVGIIVAVILTVIFTYAENDATRPSTMIVLHNQTANEDFSNLALTAARESSVPDLYLYEFANGTNTTFEISENPNDLREREKLRIGIMSAFGGNTTGWFSDRQTRRDFALVELFTTIFILLLWFFGVSAFAGPVMTLVVIPIERMVRLLGMLMVDPLGYQSTPRYKKFAAEEDELTKNSRWTKEVLKGMETSFLMSTILRIGSLMKVGFGSAGVEIIRNNLEKGQKKDTLFLNSQGSTVACIFLFCDIRQFTDATEALQEEVFVFTNKIAGVVHSICHSYGGAANKNIGDAFLLSWLLEDDAKPSTEDYTGDMGNRSHDTFTAKHNQADKALLSVVKICQALQHDNYYLEGMSETASGALLSKLSTRKGPVVQLGFGLHAGKAIQGALGSQRKIDATYVSESVEMAEFLESATKKYGVKMLMSDNFHRLLQPINRRRCRKVDQILINNEDDDSGEQLYEGDVMELFTFDMDIDALWRTDAADNNISDTDSNADKRDALRGGKPAGDGRPGLLKPRRRSLNKQINIKGGSNQALDISEDLSRTSDKGAETLNASIAKATAEGGDDGDHRHSPPELVLPTGPALYNANVWQSEEMRRIRERYSDGLFFQNFNSGLQSYYAKDWDHAKQCFETILERFEDGPSRYFLKCMEDNNGVPPRKFVGYGRP